MIITCSNCGSRHWQFIEVDAEHCAYVCQKCRQVGFYAYPMSELEVFEILN